MNQLYICRSTAENIERAEKYKYFKANERYCLVVADEEPEKMAPVTAEAAKSLTQQDWAWIKAIGEKIRAEAEYAAFEQQSREFISRFEAELKNAKERLENAGNPEGDGTE